MSAYSLSREAANDLKDIWLYSIEHWGEVRGDVYYLSLLHAFERIARDEKWSKPLQGFEQQYRETIEGSHRIIFRKRSNMKIGIVRVLGVTMDAHRHLL